MSRRELELGFVVGGECCAEREAHVKVRMRQVAFRLPIRHVWGHAGELGPCCIVGVSEFTTGQMAGPRAPTVRYVKRSQIGLCTK